MSWIKKWKPPVLCLGAGGIKGFEELGATWFFHSSSCLENVKVFIGTSIGGVICTFLSIGFSPHEILYYALDTNMFEDVSELKITELYKNCGLVSNASFDDALGKRMKAMIHTKFPKIPTLKEHYEATGKHLILVICSMKEGIKYADYKSDPDLDIVTAMRATANAPGLFGKLEYQHDLFFDGAAIDPYPILHCDDGKTPILGIGVKSERPFDIKRCDLVDYYDRVTSMPLARLTEIAVSSSSSQCYNMIIPVKDEMGLTDPSQRELRMRKFLQGYEFAKEYVRKHPHPIVVKINTNPPPLSKTALTACLESQAGKFILRAFKEDPNLMRELLEVHDIEIPQACVCPPTDVSTSPRQMSAAPRPFAKLFNMRQDARGENPQDLRPEGPAGVRVERSGEGQLVCSTSKPDEDEEEILELPRIYPNRVPGMPPLYRTRMSHDFVVQLRLSPDIIHTIIHMLKIGVKMAKNLITIAGVLNRNIESSKSHPFKR